MPKYQLVQRSHHKVKVNGVVKDRDDIIDSTLFKDQSEIDTLLAQGLIKQVSGT